MHLIARASVTVGGVILALVCAAAPALADPPFTAVPGSPFATGRSPYGVAFTPSGHQVAVADYLEGAISVFSVAAADGSLAEVAGSPVKTGSGPAGIGVAPDGGPLATAGIGSGMVSVFAIDDAGGGLRELAGSPVAAGEQPRSVAVGPAGLIAVADYAQARVAVLRADPVTGSVAAVPGSPFATGRGPSSVAFSPDGGLLATADGDAGTASLFTVDPVTGSLTAVRGSPLIAGRGPSGVAFGRGGALLAVTSSTDATVSVFTLGRDGAGAAAVPGSPFATGAAPRGVAFSPSGALLATADALGGEASVFVVDGATGALSPLAGSPYLTGANPRALAFGPGGGLLAVANAGDSTLTLLSLRPSATITSPAPGATVYTGQIIHSAFTCADNAYGPGIARCADEGGATPGAGVLDTVAPGPHTYSVTATSRSGASVSASVSYTVLLAPPTDLAPPTVRGLARRGHPLTCVPGVWTGVPSSFRIRWMRDGGVIAGASGASYKVRPIDAGSLIACSARAVNRAGVSAAVPSAASVPVALEGTAGCPAPVLELGDAGIGPVALGDRRAAVRAALRGARLNASRERDQFCIVPGALSVGYWARRGAPVGDRRGRAPRGAAAVHRELADRVAWVATRSPLIAAGALRPGTAAPRRSLRALHRLAGGDAGWYRVSSSPQGAVLVRVGGGIVRLVAVADPAALAAPAARHVLLSAIN